MMRKTLLTLLTLSLTVPALAADKTVLRCTTTKGKQLLVTESKNSFRYSYGRPGQPELVFSNGRAEALERSQTGTLILRNGGNYFYVIYRDGSNIGVRVIKGASPEDGQLLTDLACKGAVTLNFPAALND